MARLAIASRRSASFSFSALATSAPAHAQTAGATLLVEARDQSGAPVPGTLVTVISQETGLERVGTTVDDGTVWLVRLPAGSFTLSAVRSGLPLVLSRRRKETRSRTAA